MKKKLRTISTVVAVVALLFGIGCLNYTAGHGDAHHREWAEGAGFPPPSPMIFYVGAATTVLAAGRLGFVIGTRRSAKTEPDA